MNGMDTRCARVQDRQRVGNYPLLSGEAESEGHDRHSLRLPPEQLDLVKAS